MRNRAARDKTRFYPFSGQRCSAVPHYLKKGKKTKMTQPENQPPAEHGSNPPNPAPPHATQPPPSQQRPVVVQQNDPAIGAQLTDMAQKLSALPETLVNAFREATSTQPLAAAPPQEQTPAQPNAQAQTQATHDTNVGKAGYKGPSKFARWYMGLGKESGQ